ncbi:MAG: RNA 2'-phosphotransferase [Planctomycetota bacterium]
MNDTALSKLMSHALRHEPWLYELELDTEGWAPTASLVEAISRLGPEWHSLQASDIARIVEHSAKKRHDIQGDRIRAIYGHSLPGKLAKTPGKPPSVLYHGTSPEAAESILAEGLRPMGRQYVHLSVNPEVAQEVGRRKCRRPRLLMVNTAVASEADANFYVGNDQVWLADFVPAGAIKVDTDDEG